MPQVSTPTGIAVIRTSTELVAGSDSDNGGKGPPVCKVQRVDNIFYEVLGPLQDYKPLMTLARNSTTSFGDWVRSFIVLAPPELGTQFTRIKRESPDGLVRSGDRLTFIFFRIEGNIPVVAGVEMVFHVEDDNVVVTVRDSQVFDESKCPGRSDSCGLSASNKGGMRAFAATLPIVRNLAEDVKTMIQMGFDDPMARQEVGPQVRILKLDGPHVIWLQNGQGCETNRFQVNTAALPL